VNGHRHLLLLIEDHADTREALGELLRCDGYDVEEAGDGREALARLQTGLLPCLVLLDLSMPKMDGWTFRETQLREPRLAVIPVVALSGHGGVAQQAAALGMIDHLGKPPDLDKLAQIIRTTCDVAA
jgi:CheY-like chemotaxis protein